jgi:hypothetical protein
MTLLLSYPLTPIQLCFCHIDDFMNQTPNSSLFHALEKRFLDACNACNPSIDVYIPDGFFYSICLVSSH